MTDLCFRTATRDDLFAIVALLADDALARVREDARLPLDARYTSAFDAISADPNQSLIVADLGGTVVGCLQISFITTLSHRGALRGQIEGVRVAREHRGGGFGHRMIVWALAECEARGCAMVQLSTSKSRIDAQRFYTSLGFAASHEGMKLMLG